MFRDRIGALLDRVDTEAQVWPSIQHKRTLGLAFLPISDSHEFLSVELEKGQEPQAIPCIHVALVRFGDLISDRAKLMAFTLSGMYL